MLAGVLGGLIVVAGGASDGEEEEVVVEQMLGDLAHDLRGPLTVHQRSETTYTLSPGSAHYC